MSDYQDRKNNGDGFYWLIALGLIFTGVAAPVGVLMIVMKVLGGDQKKKKRQQGRHPYYQQQSGGAGARTSREVPSWEAPSQAAPSWEEPVQPPLHPKKKKGKVRDLIAELDKKGKSWAIAGGATAAGCLIAFIGSLGDPLYWLFNGDFAFFIEEIMGLMVLPCIAAAGLGGLWVGLRKRKQASRYRNYLAMVGSQSSVSISALASATGLSPSKVRDDLADMLDDGLFPQGYLDYGGDRLVLTGEGISQPATEQPKTAPPPPKEDENAILAEIKAVNDAINNEKMSAQIDRIGIITAKILDYQKTHPDKAVQLHSFLSYYLPTTLKILRAYAQLEDQEVSGSNITAAMQRIEGMMDKVVEGFEKQLDLLFQGDAMDITTDVEVLERMLAKDGLSDQQGLTLGL
ncbi:5-bromo-4-chloroindolyl phosphate hydrolysis family protein [Oscillospiraceae bacterium 44-34]